MKKFQLLIWTAEVREKELQFLFFNGHFEYTDLYLYIRLLSRNDVLV